MERNDSHQERLPGTPGKNDQEVACDNCAHVWLLSLVSVPGLGYSTSLVYQRLPLLSTNALEKQHQRRDCSCWLLVSEVSAHLRVEIVAEKSSLLVTRK